MFPVTTAMRESRRSFRLPSFRAQLLPIRKAGRKVSRYAEIPRMAVFPATLPSTAVTGRLYFREIPRLP